MRYALSLDDKPESLPADSKECERMSFPIQKCGVILTALTAVCLLLEVRTAMSEGTAAERFIVAGREAFMNALKLDRPELAEVKANLERGDVAAAERAYIKYFRSKPIPKSPALIDWDSVQRAGCCKTC